MKTRSHNTSFHAFHPKPRLRRALAGVSCILVLLWELAPGHLAGASASAAPGKTQRLERPDQVPDGLQPSDGHSIRAAYEAGRHAVLPLEDGTLTARNPGQQWRTRFDGRGFTVTPGAGGWVWGLELRRYGFAGAEQALDSGAAVTHAQGRVSYDWPHGLREWFVNDQRGLEQGWTVRERPLAPFLSPNGGEGSPLRFELAVRGGLAPKVATECASVGFADTAGAIVLNFGGLRAWDADGQALAARFEVRADTPETILVAVDESQARYPITVDPIAQQAYLKAGNTGADDRFGSSVAVSGDTVVVGAYWEASSTTGVNSTPDENAPQSGAAYVFVRSGTTWTQQAYLKASNTGAGDNFGIPVAVSGDTVVVGAWLEDSSTTGVNSTPDESAVDSGAAYVFVRSGTTWTQQAYLKASNTGDDRFGISVAVSGDTVVVGAHREDSSTTGVNSTPNESAVDSGATYVFVRSGTTWTQQAYLKASNTGATDQFGRSVAVSGDTVVVGAFWEDSSTTGVNSTPDESAPGFGAAYVFVRSGTTWTQQAYLKASNTGELDQFGISVAVSGDTVVVGAHGEDSSTTGVNSTPDESARDSGAAYVFVRSGATWTQQAYLKASNTGVSDSFGGSVAVSGDTVVVGADWEASSTTGVNSTPNESAGFSGAAYVFVRSGATWTQQAYLKASNTGVGDRFGTSVAVSGDTVVVGARLEDSSTTGVNSTPDENALESGAAYILPAWAAPP